MPFSFHAVQKQNECHYVFDFFFLSDHSICHYNTASLQQFSIKSVSSFTCAITIYQPSSITHKKEHLPNLQLKATTRVPIDSQVCNKTLDLSVSIRFVSDFVQDI